MNKGYYLLFLALVSVKCTQKNELLYQSDKYAIYQDKVVQGNFEAKALTPTHMVSSYESPSAYDMGPVVRFKFSINNVENELPAGVDHQIVIDTRLDSFVTPVITFAKQYFDSLPPEKEMFLPKDYPVTFRLDMSPVLNSFKEKGYYENNFGHKVMESDFKGVCIAGGSFPLHWKFDKLDEDKMLKDPDGDGIYEITIKLNGYNPEKNIKPEWELQSEIKQYPQFKCDQLLLEALYNMTLDEVAMLSEEDGTFRTGKKWSGVWTRDISYSIVLGLGIVDAQRAMVSLKKKVKRDRIIQDTGSGGAWPVSTDRVSWSLAAWELFCVTGDQEWLNFAYPVIRNSILDDREVVFDPETKLMRGESSFLDWREQTYPKWMQNADIYQSFNLGTNVVHYQTYRILSFMAELLGKQDDKQFFSEMGGQIKTAINKHFWDDERGYYIQYLYGRNKMIASPKSEILGEALAILYDVASEEQANRIMGNMPIVEWGTPCVYPQIPNIEPYHNNGIWPFVQSFWNLAAAKVGYEQALNHGLASIYRAASLFLTNKENMVAENGDFMTVLNSDRQLWSVAGHLGMVYKILFGLKVDQHGVLHFNPSVPKGYKGERNLTNLVLRGTSLSIQMKGFGNKVKSFKVDGEPRSDYALDLTKGGEHKVEIELADNSFAKEKSINIVKNKFHLPTPEVIVDENENQLNWTIIDGAVEYEVIADGEVVAKTGQAIFNYEQDKEYLVRAKDRDGYYSFCSEPIYTGKPQVVSLKSFAKDRSVAFSSSNQSMVELTKNKNTNLVFEIDAKEAGEYIVFFSYANGSGPWNTDNKCAMRSLLVNGEKIGIITMPQRGTNEWQLVGYTNHVMAELKIGKNKFGLVFEPYDENMNFDVNSALVGGIYYYKF